MKITVEDLRRKYPNPVAVVPETFLGDTTSYCVGWALCLELWGSRGNIGKALLTANPNLSANQACDIWEHIITENDAGNFDVAWQWLEKGLTA